MQIRRLILLPVLLIVFGQQLHAQIKVEMGYERRLFVLYEPIPVTVAITNLSGHDITLADADNQPWFSFQVTQSDGDDKRIIQPMDINYKMPGLSIPMGATVKQTVNLCAMYAVQDVGIYHLRASIYSQEAKKYYSSTPDELEVTEGKVFWEQTVGVPEGAGVKGTHRTLSLLTFRQPKYNVLYYRVQDKDTNTIYATSPLGVLVASVDPDFKLDKDNTLHVLQLIAPRSFIYSRIGLNGTCEQMNYHAVTTRPELKKDAEGEVYVSGGKVDDGTDTAGSAPASTDGPKVSDRPAGFPAAGGQ